MGANEKKYMGLCEYAAHRQVQTPTLRHYIASGLMTAFTKKGREYVIDVEACDAQIEAGRDYTRAKSVKESTSSKNYEDDDDNEESDDDSGAPNSITAAKTKKEKFAAMLKQLEYEEKVGTLVKKADVYKELFEMGKELRQELQALPDRVIDDILAQRTRHDAHRVLSEAVNTMLERVTEIENREI